MLPQGHTPGDKTLYFLAKLSKEVNATRASQLLTEEIDRRCLNLPKDAKNRIVTNTDIKSVLDSIRPPNAMDTSHTRSLEPSITPQPPAPQSSRKEATAVKSVIQSHPPNKAPASSQVSPVQTSGQGQNITARNSNVQSMKKNLNKSHQPQEQTPSRCNPPTQGTASQFQEQSIERILKLSLPPPPRMNLSSGLQNFSSKFVQKHIGGVESTFATVSIDKRDQAVPWHVIIRANTVAHRYAPRLGVHGALTLVQGKPNNGIIGNTYPVILKTDTDKHSYIGHYEVVSRHTLPVAAWLDEAEGTRIRIAKELADTKWGEQLLRKRDIKCDGATLSDRIDQILRCFESDSSQPHLRAEWVVLQLKTFKHDQYNNLLAELATEYYPGADKDVQSVSEAPQQDFVEWYKKQWLADRPKSDRFDRLPAHPKSWDHLIAEVGEKDQMFGKPYKSPAEITLLKEYIVELTLGKKGFVLPKIGELHSTKILEVFNTVLAIFIQHNEELREQQQIDHAERHAKRHKDSFQERGQSSTASASQKRRRVGGEAQPTKRSKIISRTSIPEVMLNSWEKNIDGLLVEEPNGSTIFVDTAGSEEPEVKIDEDNGVEEDLYNATPAPKGRGKPRKAAGA
ncbi:hypothetical protein N431DRAFT_16849 [Stipitochalara longipes BDJ]|nr:hypothetical protein N431DRAFT_16849 [Stipitochalara longipes BDJ]